MGRHSFGFDSARAICFVTDGRTFKHANCMFDRTLVRPYTQRGMRETARKTRPNAVLQGRPWKKPTLRLHACSGGHLVDGVPPVLFLGNFIILLEVFLIRNLGQFLDDGGDDGDDD